MDRNGALKQTVDTTGEVLGKFATAGRAQVRVRGWILSNSGTASGQVNFHEPASPPAGSGNQPTLPASTDPVQFSVVVPAGASKEFFDETGILFKEGCFMQVVDVAGGAVAGVVLYS